MVLATFGPLYNSKTALSFFFSSQFLYVINMSKQTRTNPPPICSVCGGNITGKYIQDFWGNNYHSGHLSTNPPCEYCGRLISKPSTGGGTTYKDGRRICALCKSEAVEDEKRGLEILYQANSLLHKAGIALKPFHPSFNLLDRNTLKRRSGRGEEQGFTHTKRKTDSRGKILELKIRVFILHGLPYHAFLSTAAHELMHAWLQLNGRGDAKKWLIEGSCNMAAYLVLRLKGGLKSEYQIFQMREQRDKVYGKGFNKVLAFVNRRGVKTWLNVLHTRTRLPLL